MKTITLTILALLLLSACAQTETSEEVKFGASLQLTGPQVMYGELSRVGIDLAIEDINAEGGINGKTVRVIYEDNAGDKQKAVTNAQKLIEIDNVDALLTITPFTAGVIAPVAEDNKVPFIHVGSVNSHTINRTFVFKDYPDVGDICELLVEQALKDGHKKISFFGIDGESSQICRQRISKLIEISRFETYSAGETDYATQFTKIKNSESTALLLYAFVGDCANAYKYIRDLNLNTQLYLVIQSFTCGDTKNTQAHSDMLKNAYGADIALDKKSPEFIEFKKRIDAHGGSPHLEGTALMYDITKEMAKAMQGCNDSICTSNNLRALNNYAGISGVISFNGNQVSHRDVMLTKYENGAWEKVK